MHSVYGDETSRVYNLSSFKRAQSIPGTKKRKKVFADRTHIDLIQDFTMPDIATSLELSPDGEYLMACGIYKPTVKCYSLAQMSVKFQRGMDAEVVAFKIFSQNYQVVFFLQEQRYFEVHNKCGRLTRTLLPYQGRDLVFNPYFGEVYIASSMGEIYRMDTVHGRFLTSFEKSSDPLNKISFCKDKIRLLGGTDKGDVHLYDLREKKKYPRHTFYSPGFSPPQYHT